MVHISIWPKFQTWHWTKWTSLVDRLHWSIPIKAKGYLQNDQFSAVPLKKCFFFCFCLFSSQNQILLFISPYWGRRGSPLLWADPLRRQENRSPKDTKHYITLHYKSAHSFFAKFSSVQILSTCRKLAAPSTFSTSSGKRCIPGKENKIELINCLAFLFKKQHLPSKKSALMGKSVRSRHGGGA